jgi:hypothetical protein
MHGRVLGDRQSLINFSSIQLYGEFVLNLIARTFGAKVPIILRHVKAGGERGNTEANGVGDGEGEGQLKQRQKLKDTWRTFRPRRKMGNL